MNNKYDQKDYICPKTHLNAGRRKLHQDMVPSDQLTRNAYNWNKFSTLIDEYRSVTILPDPAKSDENKWNKSKRRKYYNY